MRPDARVQAAIEVLGRWRGNDLPAERVLADWGRANRYAGSGDRRAIADLVYDAIRRWCSAAWLVGSEEPRAVVLGTLLQAGADVDGLFSGTRHGPARLDAAERAAKAPADLARAPWGIRLDLPDWLEAELEGVPEEALAGLRHRAPLDLRVNRLKADRADAIARLAEDGIEAVPGPLSADCLRVVEGWHRVQRSGAYVAGLVEIQDAASQAGAAFAQVQPGEHVVDFCAGGGGKALAMAAAQRGEGRIEAYDIAPARLAQIPVRAARAGAEIAILSDADLAKRRGAADCIFVDAPCSGSGAWRRTPEAKWRLTPERLADLRAAQTRIISQAAALMRPGGRLIYATCSLLHCENTDQIRTAEEENPALTCELSHSWTDLNEGDGFFVAKLT
ncbi:MAG: RsmB/NOP family class I SAM-dependent RNA methyltransferase [Pseudomonadota bacterium]